MEEEDFYEDRHQAVYTDQYTSAREITAPFEENEMDTIDRQYDEKHEETRRNMDALLEESSSWSE